MMKAQTMKNEMARVGIAQQQADTAQNYLGLAGKKFEQDKETQKFTKSMRAMEFAFQNSRTPEEFASSYKEMTGEDVKVKFSGKNITMQFPDKDGNMMEVSGPSEVVADAVAAFSKDPSHALDPEKGKVSFEYLARQGVSFKKIPAKGEDKDFTLGEGQARYDASGKKIAERPKTIDTEKTKELESLKSDYMQQVGRGYSAERGTGQFIPDENKAAVAKKAYDSSMIIAQQYVNAGGKWEDLGLEDPGKTSEAKDDFVVQLTKTHPPAEYKGQSGTDTETGKKYKSDGKNWVEVKQ
jgi:hypothetical protein